MPLPVAASESRWLLCFVVVVVAFVFVFVAFAARARARQHHDHHRPTTETQTMNEPRASLEKWHIVCREPLPPLGTSPNVTIVVHPINSELVALAADLAKLTPSTVVTVSARVLPAGTVRHFARALALATRGVLLSDPPMVFDIAILGERQPPLGEAWATLVAAAAAGAASFEKEMAAWQPPSDDDSM